MRKRLACFGVKKEGIGGSYCCWGVLILTLLARSRTAAFRMDGISSSTTRNIRQRTAEIQAPRLHATTSGRKSTEYSEKSTPSSSSMRFVSGIENVVDDYDVFLLDMWGVLHDGSKPYEGVLETLQQLKERQKELVILSNSSKRQDSSIKMLRKLGFDPSDFGQIITSGEISYRMLAGDTSLECDTWSVLHDLRANNQRNVFVFGSGNQDDEYMESAGWTLAPIGEANLIVARGTFTINDGKSIINKNKDGEERYFEALKRALTVASERQVPMLVTNPDKVRPDEGFPPMPGAIGDSYEAALGDEGLAESLVKRIGKPFPAVFQLALRGTEASQACMVGDALETDVTGGLGVGISTIWSVYDGIHRTAVMEQDSSLEKGCAEVLGEFNAKDGTYAKGKVLKPTIVIPRFRW